MANIQIHVLLVLLTINGMTTLIVVVGYGARHWGTCPSTSNNNFLSSLLSDTKSITADSSFLSTIGILSRLDRTKIVFTRGPSRGLYDAA